MDSAKAFGYVKAGYNIPQAKSKTHGNLLLDGLPIEFNKPFAILQALKGTKYEHIYPRNRVKIVAVKI